MLMLAFYQLSVCVSLFGFLLLSANCVALLGCPKAKKEERGAIVLILILWVMASFNGVYEGFFLVGKSPYGAFVIGGGLLSMLPLLIGDFRKGRLVKGKLWLILCFCVVSTVKICAEDSCICDVFYSLLLLLLGGNTFQRLFGSFKISYWVSRRLVDLTTVTTGFTANTVEGLGRVWLSSDKEMALADFLNSEIYKSKITIDKVARQIRTNRTYVSRYFNQQKKKTLLEYVKEMRMLKVKERLTQTKEPVTVVYENAGFNSSTFYSAFKIETKMTPEQWRLLNGDSASAGEGVDS